MATAKTSQKEQIVELEDRLDTARQEALEWQALASAHRLRVQEVEDELARVRAKGLADNQMPSPASPAGP